ncbi:flagellin lysine-N-methylase [Pseudogulbenkiania subflava]|uniref:Lysine-N-methylase n=1 Tax=Pseudogulbenkiania subflava DSM 22618 TaxID=1123014 RepID=A0A1Y6C3Q3_9NEIS|nr:flagellin lysine-N-methylase [Pseudogulbenkiania subflava]SMF40220.1 lysine-N-methylase [Pseudogulbenkiania subflava DSM 22618]
MKAVLNKTMVVPHYVTQFQCAGPACPDSCCAGWRITFDKETFLRYKNSPDPVLKPLFDQYLKRNRQETSPAMYGQILLEGEQQRCGLLTDGGLCQVHARLGEAALSNTCYIYPRHVRQFAGQYEQALTLSCPAAARLALLSPDAFDFVAADFETRKDTLVIVGAKYGFDAVTMDEVRVLMMQLLRTEGISVAERLAVIGLFCEQLDMLIRERRHAELPAQIVSFIQMVESGAVLEGVGALPRNEALQAQIFVLFFAGVRSERYSPWQQEVFETIVRGLGSDANGQAAQETLIAQYQSGRALLNTVEGLEDKLERYLLNEAARELFPWSSTSPYRHYVQLVVHFGIVRLMLAAYAAAHDRALAPDEVVRVVQVFCRAYQHNATFMANVQHILSRSEWNTLDKLYALLK